MLASMFRQPDNHFLKKQLNNLIVLISIRIPVDRNADAILV